jgi:hypothetical protein
LNTRNFQSASRADGCAAASWSIQICSYFGREVSQIVNAEFLFNLGDMIDNFEESALDTRRTS